LFSVVLDSVVFRTGGVLSSPVAELGVLRSPVAELELTRSGFKLGLVSRFILTTLRSPSGGVRAALPVGGNTTGIRAAADNSGELFYAVLDSPIRYRGADINQVILRPAERGQVPHYGMRAFGVEIAPVLDPALRTAEVIDPFLLEFVAFGEIDDDHPAEPAPPAGRDEDDSETPSGDEPQIPDDRRTPRAAAGSPRQARRPPVWIAAGAAAVLAAGGIVVWAGRSGSGEKPSAPAASTQVSAAPAPTTVTPVTAVAPAEKPEAVLKLLPPGYGPGACQPADSVPVGALAALECGPNADAGGPQRATFTLFADTGGLQRVFAQTVAGSEQQICPGRIQSPGPWRRNAAPEVPAGTLFCGTRQETSLIAWTDDARTLLAVVESDTGPPMQAMYDWWTTQSCGCEDCT
jgi:hypothetical protein